MLAYTMIQSMLPNWEVGTLILSLWLDQQDGVGPLASDLPRLAGPTNICDPPHLAGPISI